ncbi:MAG: homoserine dehydrogenase [Ruminococcaceae bacterium]|nr:homoserine dehydrogenase [Oscillospiraceae bacterium]
MTNIALLGFGTVGSGVADVLCENAARIADKTGLSFHIKFILDLREFPNHPLGDRVVHDFNTILNDPEVSIVVEMMGGVHPAYDFSMAAIRSGKNVVTSNKAVVAAYGPELLEEARRQGVRYLFEASVGGGIPIIRPLTEQAAENDITEIVGILNGTTNYILTAMKNTGVTFDKALATAQALGYAEADPTADVDGFDTCRKICILAAVAFGTLVPYENVRTVGIRKVTAEDVAKAEVSGYAIKLVARALRTEGGVYLSVEPTAVKRSHPLYAIEDVYNGILVRGRVSGDLLFYGMGAGKLPTAGAVVTDILDIASRGNAQPLQSLWTRDASIYVPFLTASEEEETLATLGYPI